MMPVARSTSELARAREDAAAELEVAIVAVGAAYQEYARLTQTLSERVGDHLAWQLEVPINLHMVSAGLARFLERSCSPRVDWSRSGSSSNAIINTSV